MPEKQRKTIYIADDDKAVRDSLCAFLETCGYDVRAYADGDDFLRHADARRADCLLLDLDLPGASGRQVLEQLRASGVTTPAIVLTTNGKRVGSRLQKANVLAVLSKPVAGEELLRWLEKACR